jgi:hypothetical protein
MRLLSLGVAALASAGVVGAAAPTAVVDRAPTGDDADSIVQEIWSIVPPYNASEPLSFEHSGGPGEARPLLSTAADDDAGLASTLLENDDSSPPGASVGDLIRDHSNALGSANRTAAYAEAAAAAAAASSSSPPPSSSEAPPPPGAATDAAEAGTVSQSARSDNCLKVWEVRMMFLGICVSVHNQESHGSPAAFRCRRAAGHLRRTTTCGA